jgi:imidazoleglycerol phosphate synthase cyclase subunit
VHQAIGNPLSTIKRLSDWNVDELLLLDISRDDYHDLRRDDLQIRYEGSGTLDLLRAIAKVCFMPLSFGGRIRSMEDIRVRLAAGADKCIINSRAVEAPGFLTEAARRFGSQCVVSSIDVFRHADGRYEVFSHSGRHATGLHPVDWAAEVERLGAGEIFLNSIDRDGSAAGYDVSLIRSVSGRVGIPVIACGGVGAYADFPQGIVDGMASAVSAANIFHFFENSYPLAKQACMDAGIDMRPVDFSGRWLKREPEYGDQDRARAAERLSIASGRPPRDTHTVAWRRNVRWCSRCVYPAISAAPMEFDEQGECMGCRMAEVKNAISPEEWDRRRSLLRNLLDRYRCRDGSRHDCVIAVSGGKDSWFQTHVIKNEFGLNPLLVTYNGNNYTDAGWRNLMRMREIFNVDHIIYSPGVELLRKLNRLAMTVMGDMNWHCHVGITTLPVRMAVQNRIPLVIWGEHGYLDLCGQFSMDDFPEMSYRDRLEHFARGYEWNFFVGQEGITSQDMIPYQYPSDRELFDLDVRGIYIGNYLRWEANEHGRMMIDLYGFEISPEPFDRTYRRMSNLDDMHENGVHDYLKYVKFGYGRCTDHACKDIRAGIMTRDQAIERVRGYDHVKPRDLARWLDYVGWTEEQFDRIADTFRDQRVWRRQNGEWVKDNLWDA